MSFLRRVTLSRRWLVLPPAVIGVGAVVALAQFQTELPRSEHQEYVNPLPVIRVHREEVVPRVTGFGTSASARRWSAVAEVQGRIVYIHPHLESGNSVEANELLARIDDTDRQLLLSQRQADLDSAYARLQELQAGYESDQQLLPLLQQQLRVSENNEQRLLELRRQNATSQGDVDRAVSSRLTQEQAVQNVQRALALFPSQMNGAKAAVALAEAKLREAERDIERSNIYSPFAGVLSGVDLEEGQFVGANETLFELIDDRHIEVAAHFSLEQIEKLTRRSKIDGNNSVAMERDLDTPLAGHGGRGMPLKARVIVRSGDVTRSWLGIPVRLLESLNEHSRTLAVVVQVIEPTGPAMPYLSDGKQDADPECQDAVTCWATALRPGMFCEVVLEGVPQSGLITIPRSAIDGDRVYVIDSDNRLRARRVIEGFKTGESTTIISGLSEGEYVAAIAPVPAIEGQLVEKRLIDQRADERVSQLEERTSSGLDLEGAQKK